MASKETQDGKWYVPDHLQIANKIYGEPVELASPEEDQVISPRISAGFTGSYEQVPAPKLQSILEEVELNECNRLKESQKWQSALSVSWENGLVKLQNGVKYYALPTVIFSVGITTIVLHVIAIIFAVREGNIY